MSKVTNTLKWKYPKRVHYSLWLLTTLQAGVWDGTALGQKKSHHLTDPIGSSQYAITLAICIELSALRSCKGQMGISKLFIPTSLRNIHQRFVKNLQQMFIFIFHRIIYFQISDKMLFICEGYHSIKKRFKSVSRPQVQIGKIESSVSNEQFVLTSPFFNMRRTF